MNRSIDEAPLRPEDAPPEIYGTSGEPRFFHDPAIDRIMAVMMNLAQEVWVQEERVRTMEENRGAEAVDREALLRTFIDRVFEPLRRA